MPDKATSTEKAAPERIGIYRPDTLSNEEYHGGPGIGSSMLKVIHDKTPSHLEGGERKVTTALDEGTAFHTAILEPHEFGKTIMKGPPDRRGNKWKDALEEAAAQGKILLVEASYDEAQRVRDALHARPHIARYLQKNDAMAEYSAYAKEDDGTLLRVRPDLVLPNDGIMIDVKSAESASLERFTRAVFNYGYHLQQAMYPYVWNRAGGQEEGQPPIERFLFVTVEKDPPYACALFELDDEAKEQGWAAFRNALDIYNICKANNEWPGYSEDIQKIEMPRWLNRLPPEED